MAKMFSFKLTAIILTTLYYCVTSDSDDFTYFGNMGPEHWSEFFNKCSGKQQSPININEVDVINRTYSKIIYKEFNKLPLEASIINNGHTVLVKMLYGDEIPSIEGGPLEGKGIYQFQQLHFHWGEDNTVGSEDRINDVAYPMELHIVFRNSKYKSFEEAARKDDGIAVLAAFYEVGNYTSMAYDHLTSHLEHIQEPHTSATVTQPMELFSLLNVDFLHKYYTYIGSLTTPPCSEDVIWIDYMNPIGISPEMVERFRYLKTFDGSSLTHNFRPLQPLNNRKVYRAISEWNKKNVDNLANLATTVTSLQSLIVSLVCVRITITIISNINSYFLSI